MNDIPVDLEEATDPKAREVIASAVYDINNGKDKGRCNVEGKVRDDIKTFRTAVHVTCENPLRESLNNAGASYRTGQVGDLLPDGLGDMVSKVKRGIQDNYGFFFPLYIQHIICNKSRLDALYEEAFEKIESACDLSPESRSIVERSKFIYAGVLVAGWLCEEVFQEIGLPSRSKEEVVRIVNHYFKVNVISEPVEPDWVRALRIIYDWTVTESRKFISSNTTDYNRSDIVGEISTKYIDIIGTEFRKKMNSEGFNSTIIKSKFVENGIIDKGSRDDGNYKIKINGTKINGCRFKKDAIRKVLDLKKETPESLEEMQVLKVIDLLTEIDGSAQLEKIEYIMGYNVSYTLQSLSNRLFKDLDGSYKRTDWYED
jgi:uncharacterized protein (DUF927 family)